MFVTDFFSELNEDNNEYVVFVNNKAVSKSRDRFEAEKDLQFLRSKGYDAELKKLQCAYVSLNESKTNQFVQNYLPWLQKELGLKELPKIKLLDMPEDTTFGKYGGGTLYVVTGGRHPVDVLRTLAHELTHFKQDGKGELTDGAGETGTPQENEANSNAGIIMRNFAKNHPEEFGLDEQLHEEIGPGVGQELELMLAGKKPAALANDIAKWQDAIAQNGWSTIKLQIPAKFGSPSNYSTYIISTDPQRARAIQQLLIAGWDGSQPINKEYHTKLGQLLGYSAFDIAHFIMRGAVRDAIVGTGKVLHNMFSPIIKKLGMNEETANQQIRFADGYVVFSNHFKERLRQRNISVESILRLLNRVESRREEDLINMPFVNFVIKSNDLGISLKKEKNGDRTVYVASTVHPDLNVGEDEDVIYLEDEEVNETIRKVKGGYKVLSKKGKNLGGPYKSKSQAQKRLGQVEYFKHMKEDDNWGKMSSNSPKDTSAIKDLKKDLKEPYSYDAIDHMMTTIAKKYNMTPHDLHLLFVDKVGTTPDVWIRKSGTDPDKWSSKKVNENSSIIAYRGSHHQGNEHESHSWPNIVFLSKNPNVARQYGDVKQYELRPNIKILDLDPSNFDARRALFWAYHDIYDLKDPDDLKDEELFNELLGDSYSENAIGLFPGKNAKTILGAFGYDGAGWGDDFYLIGNLNKFLNKPALHEFAPPKDDSNNGGDDAINHLKAMAASWCKNPNPRIERELRDLGYHINMLKSQNGVILYPLDKSYDTIKFSKDELFPKNVNESIKNRPPSLRKVAGVKEGESINHTHLLRLRGRINTMKSSKNKNTRNRGIQLERQVQTFKNFHPMKNPAVGAQVMESENTTSPAQTWVKKVYDMYPDWPYGQADKVMVWGEGQDQQFAAFKLKPLNSKVPTVDIEWIMTGPEHRQGVGSRAMKELQRLAQEDGIRLTLYPWDKGQVKQRDLIRFYKNQGFNPQVKGSKQMHWQPNTK